MLWLWANPVLLFYGLRGMLKKKLWFQAVFLVTLLLVPFDVNNRFVFYSYAMVMWCAVDETKGNKWAIALYTVSVFVQLQAWLMMVANKVS
jgi:hypothetical protein